MATKLPIEGRFDKPSEGLWTAISYLLRNAFIYALRPSIDDDIDLSKVNEPSEKKGFLQELFGKKDKKEKGKK